MSPSSGGGAVSTAGLGAGVGQTQVYLQHLRMHQVQHQLRRCPTCRLNFTNKSDYQVGITLVASRFNLIIFAPLPTTFLSRLLLFSSHA